MADRQEIIFSLPLQCSLCGVEKTFFGEEKKGDFRQAKINAYVSAAESGWYIDYMPTGHICESCQKEK